MSGISGIGAGVYHSAVESIREHGKNMLQAVREGHSPDAADTPQHSGGSGNNLAPINTSSISGPNPLNLSV